MKKLMILLSAVFLGLTAQAQINEAKPFKEVVTNVQSTQLNFSEVGMAFGFQTIKSCVYTSENLIVIKNYCMPKKNYPAKGFLIISPKFGMVELYQESLSDILKRDVRIEAFPVVVREHLPTDMSRMTLAEINKVIETIHYKYGPACWSTNFSFYTESPDVSCNTKEVQDFDLWSNETQTLLQNEKAWLELIQQLEAQFNN